MDIASARTAYEILGVEPDASADRVRYAYLKLAKDEHPDRHGGKAEQEERFKQIVSAFQTLRDPDRRRLHDLKHGLSSDQAASARALGRLGATFFAAAGIGALATFLIVQAAHRSNLSDDLKSAEQTLWRMASLNGFSRTEAQDDPQELPAASHGASPDEPGETAALASAPPAGPDIVTTLNTVRRAGQQLASLYAERESSADAHDAPVPVTPSADAAASDAEKLEEPDHLSNPEGGHAAVADEVAAQTPAQPDRLTAPGAPRRVGQHLASLYAERESSADAHDTPVPVTPSADAAASDAENVEEPAASEPVHLSNPEEGHAAVAGDVAAQTPAQPDRLTAPGAPRRVGQHLASLYADRSRASDENSDTLPASAEEPAENSGGDQSDLVKRGEPISFSYRRGPQFTASQAQPDAQLAEPAEPKVIRRVVGQRLASLFAGRTSAVAGDDRAIQGPEATAVAPVLAPEALRKFGLAHAKHKALQAKAAAAFETAPLPEPRPNVRARARPAQARPKASEPAREANAVKRTDARKTDSQRSNEARKSPAKPASVRMQPPVKSAPATPVRQTPREIFFGGS